MKRVLFVATVDQHIRHFHVPYLRWFQEKGFKVSVASNGNENVPYVDIKHDVTFERSPWSFNNIIAFFEIRKIIKKNKYNLIHTHTPVASILVRVANVSLGKPAKVLYTAHGFHFYKGAKVLNWLLYYPIEKLLSNFTDSLITINQEDYDIANKKRFGCKNIHLVNGVGVNLEQFKMPTQIEKNKLRLKYGLERDDFVLIYVGELSKRKNQELLLNVVHDLSLKIKELKLLLVGKGDEESNLRALCSSLGLDNVVKFLGYRRDIPNLMKISDLSVSTALQEGLPVNVMESLSVGLPCIVSNCRGNRDIIKDNLNGFVIEKYDSQEFVEKIHQLYSNNALLKRVKGNTEESVVKYSEKNVVQSMSYIYSSYFESKNE